MEQERKGQEFHLCPMQYDIADRLIIQFSMKGETVFDPFGGIGKPEPLKYLGPGVWSRRLTQEHRIVYLVGAGRVDFLQARYHY